MKKGIATPLFIPRPSAFIPHMTPSGLSCIIVLVSRLVPYPFGTAERIEETGPKSRYYKGGGWSYYGQRW